MGDFKPLPKGADFKFLGATRTPLTYLIDCVQRIKELLNVSPTTTIFSDGYKEELEDILNLENITLSECSIDVVDLINLSRSKIISTSAHSSFSEWAGFLSESPIIRHPDHMHNKIRLSHQHSEGSIDSFEDYLKDSLTISFQ